MAATKAAYKISDYPDIATAKEVRTLLIAQSLDVGAGMALSKSFTDMFNYQ